jgi:UDPglucose 6-dehydrogenase
VHRNDRTLIIVNAGVFARRDRSMKISVIGAGYVGLTTAACLAHIGHDVFCSESDEVKLRKLQGGIIPIFEPDLDRVVAQAVRDGRLAFGSTVEAIDRAETIFICVGTPPLPNGDADLSAIESLADTMARRATGYKLIVEKSTVPVRTASQLRRHLKARSTLGVEFDVASNPEFLREGSAVHDFLHPDRIVIGVSSGHAELVLREIYAPILDQTFVCPVHSACPQRSEVPLLVTDTNSSELIKHASNSFLATKISFINMIADLCEAAGADVTEVARGMGMDPRISPDFLNPGIGFGGFCFPKDVQALVRIAANAGCDFSLLKEVENVNRRRIERFVDKVREELCGIRGRKIAIWGLAFKPNTDDVRFAPAIHLLRALVREGAQVSAYDPRATENARAVFPDIQYCADSYQAAQNADAILITTEWEEFSKTDWKRLKELVARPLIVDGRNMFSPAYMTSRGFRYISVGRPTMQTIPAYVLVTPARNEAEFIERTLKSMVAQTIPPLKWVIVSDGSTDGTDDIVRKYAADHPWIDLVRMPERRERHFAGKVHAFDAGYDRVKDLAFDIIGNLDADVSFKQDHFEFLVTKMAENPQLGVAGAPFREGSYQYDYRFTNIQNVWGGCQLFRRQCFEAIGGYMPLKGGCVDHVAVLSARMKGWQTRTFIEKVCLHHRAMGTALQGGLKAKFKLGTKDYSVGNHPLWQLFRTFYQMSQPPFVVGGLALGCGYAWSLVRRAEIPVTRELVAFVRQEQMKRLGRFFTGETLSRPMAPQKS